MIHDPNDPEFQEAMKYLALPSDEKIKLRSQAFDAKKACWVPDPKESFVAAEIQSAKDEQVTVKTSEGDVRRRISSFSPRQNDVSLLLQIKTFKKDEVQQMNPPKYCCSDDMADLTYLNDASVLGNLRDRYSRWLIYVNARRATKRLVVEVFSSDLFGFVLRGDQSVQTFADLHDESRSGVSRKETHGSRAASLRHCGQRLLEHVTRFDERTNERTIEFDSMFQIATINRC